jgi:hypothetical protein
MGDRSGTVQGGFRWGNLRERNHLENKDVVGRIICTPKKQDGKA